MKARVLSIFITSTLVAPIAAFAQPNPTPTPAAQASNANHGELTRAEVRADLVRVERAGFLPVASDVHYPDDIQHAEAVAARTAAAQTVPRDKGR
ncbi:DUF4148 domain-containing protein [Paraburkholderia acidisoli]|uniref:DUF4148 domain-containing protein n=1 Tax=Paraburkholderia acidisoli TaxID=2571748 RepID=A0A7Z2GQ68_9BURK|nr:DUF4148 domain-containing protein [Paraburkholderia acidisoli]QGZ65654.1 DUF4148 domain-containing protein [Paraburkholderia acidisoli]